MEARMVWDAETQRRFDSLRERQLNGELSAAEQHELDALLAALDAEEANYLTPAIARIDQELHQAEAQLAALQIRNEELAALARQHEQLLSEAASWLEQFDQRRLVLQNRYARLTGEPLPTERGQ
jgi:hypothetical protein